MARVNKGNFALAAGFTIILGLLACSTIEVYRLQQTISRREAEVYQAHIVRENALFGLRDCLRSGATYAREYLLTGKAARYQSRVARIERDGVELAGVLGPEVAKSFSAYVGALKALENSGPGDREDALSRIEMALQPPRTSAIGTLERSRGEMQRELRSAEEEVRRTQGGIIWQLLLVLGGTLLVGLAIATLTMRYVRNWQRERAARSVEMAHLSARLQEVQEEERKFLARELHDEVGQTLTALKMELSPAVAEMQTADGRERLRNCQDLAERAVGTVRHISLMLRPSLLDDLGLGAALEWHLNDFSRRTGIRADYVTDEALPDLSDEKRTCIYRVAQEALNNCAKYSMATKVRLTLKVCGESILLEVSDNGTGFRPTPRGVPAHGTGLIGIRERVARLNGSVMIDSCPGEGTRIVVSLPLTQRERESRMVSV
ncbi:MAG TPA: sensor histidine kinase [Bryobacteraceae bacterium]|nr:sensor histidine kinase [Bryobacteraceae bacterium]